MFAIFRLIRLLLLCLLPMAGWAQSSLPPCLSDVTAYWHNCFGTVTLPGGAKHVAEWRDNRANGQGIRYASNGTISEQGRWENGRLVQSFAVDTNRFPFNPQTPAAASAVGWVQSSLPPCPSGVRAYLHDCVGTMTFPSGNKYVGEFKDNKYNGQGTFTFANGEKYVGEFKDGQRNGQGIEYRADGVVGRSG